MVEFAVEKGDGSMFSPEAGGEPRKIATIQVLLSFCSFRSNLFHQFCEGRPGVCQGSFFL